jgi:hypothetical protein
LSRGPPATILCAAAILPPGAVLPSTGCPRGQEKAA